MLEEEKGRLNIQEAKMSEEEKTVKKTKEAGSREEKEDGELTSEMWKLHC